VVDGLQAHCSGPPADLGYPIPVNPFKACSENISTQMNGAHRSDSRPCELTAAHLAELEGFNGSGHSSEHCRKIVGSASSGDAAHCDFNAELFATVGRPRWAQHSGQPEVTSSSSKSLVGTGLVSHAELLDVLGNGPRANMARPAHQCCAKHERGLFINASALANGYAKIRFGAGNVQ